MKRIVALCTMVFGLQLVTQLPVQAAAHMQSGLTITQPWSRATPGVVKVGAAYLAIHNMGQEMDKLVGVSTSVAEKAELHTHTMDKGMMRMRQVHAVGVHPGEPAVFKPGGNHIMLMGLKQPLKEGESFELTLKFEKAGEKIITVPVKGIGAMSSHAGGKHKATGQDDMKKKMGQGEHKMY